MKNGDRLLCVKTYYRSKRCKTPNFIKGKIYKVVSDREHIKDENGQELFLFFWEIRTIFVPYKPMSHKRGTQWSILRQQ